MSCNGWESGQITLPSAAVAPLKKTLRDYVNALHAQVRTEAIRIHKDECKATRSAAVYRQRLQAFERSRWTAPASRFGQGSRPTMVQQMAIHVLEQMLHTSPTPHQPTLADVEQVAPRATNRTESFAVVGSYGYREGTISFAGRVVTWDVREGNRSVDNARESAIGGLFFAALNRMTWTRGTGGVLWGNNEYNEGPHGHDRGPDYVASHFGPLGTEHVTMQYRAAGFDARTARSLATPQPVRRAARW